MESTYPYQFHAGEPGILVEIYLPKRSEYQSTLYKTLTNGFSLDYRNHFLEPEAMQKIKKLIALYPNIANYDEALINRMEEDFSPIFNGYSMYEVDGVFASMMAGRHTIEERTQVIKIIFLPDYEKIAEKFNVPLREILGSCRQFLTDARVTSEEFQADYRTLPPNLLTERNIPILQHFEHWIDAVALFLFGYLIFEICEKLVDLQKEAGLDPDVVPLEEEIWLSSIWGYNITRVKFENHQGNEG